MGQKLKQKISLGRCHGSGCGKMVGFEVQSEVYLPQDFLVNWIQDGRKIEESITAPIF